MHPLALIVNPERSQNSTLMNYLNSSTDFDFMEVMTEEKAQEWVKNVDRKVDIVFVSWKINWNSPHFLAQLRSKEQTRNALIYLIVFNEDYDMIREFFGAGDLIDQILIKPFRARELVQRVRHFLRAPLSDESSALIVDGNGTTRMMIKDCLGSMGFMRIMDVSSGEEAVEIVKSGKNLFSLIVSTWEMGENSAFRLHRAIQQTSRVAGTPLLLVTSQMSIDQIRQVQSSATYINGLLLTPFEPKILRIEIQSIVEKIQRNRIVRIAEAEAKSLYSSGDHARALECLSLAAQRLPDAAAVYEALGDTYRQESGCELKALDAYEKAVKIEPYRPQLVAKCSEAYLVVGRMQETIRLIKNYLLRFGFDDRARTELAKIFLKAGDYGAACVELRRCANINPSNKAATALLQVASSLEATKKAA